MGQIHNYSQKAHIYKKEANVSQKKIRSKFQKGYKMWKLAELKSDKLTINKTTKKWKYKDNLILRLKATKHNLVKKKLNRSYKWE